MKKKIISLAATFALASVVCSGVALNAASAKATVASNASVSTTVQSGEWTITGLDGEKTYGTSVAMPTATVTDGGKQITAKAYVCLPNGSNVSGETFTLSQAGTYTVCFYAQDGEKLYKTERTFVVDAPFVSVGENSSAEYGTYTGCGSTTNNKGFLLRIAEGEEVTFNKLIDISALSSSDTLFSAFVTPDQEGVPDFDRVIFTLTDAVDPTCTLTIAGDRVARDTWLGSEGVTYFKAAGENQSLTGIESFGTVNEKVHVNSEWGCGISHSFCAQRINEAGNALTTMIPSNNPIKMRYDKDGQTLVVNGNTMADLDNAKYSKSLWHGFPSGKAKLSVSASGYNGKTANLCVTEIFGLDFAETTVEDVTAPEITVNAAYDAMPIGEVGCNYPLPDATAVDDYIGICEVTRRVVYNYGEVGAVTVPVVDGKIRADYIGTYTIIYSAEDYYGNASESFLTFNIAKDVEDIAIALPEYDESYYCGGFVKIQDAVLSGGVGNLTCKTRVYYGDKEVSVEKNTFKVSGAGEWKIVYEVTDYTGATKTATATFNGVAADGAMFVERPVLPKVLIGGCDYVFENYYAELYTNSGMSHVLCSLKVTDKNGTKTLNAGDTYVPNVEKSGDTVMVVFVANGVESDAYEIPVANVRTGNADDGYSIDMTQYLLGEGLKKTAKSLEIEVEAEEDGDLSWTFANALLHGNFSLELNAIPEKDLFSGLQITLTDAYDASRAVSVILEKKSGKTRLRAGKNTAELTTVGFECKEKSSIVLSYRPLNDDEHTLYQTEKTNKYYADELVKWKELLGDGGELYFWNYSTYFDNYFTPLDTVNAMQGTYQFLKEQGVTAIYDQGQLNSANSTDWTALKIYLKSCLIKNVNTVLWTDDTTMKGGAVEKFFRAYYGDAWGTMLDLYATERAWLANLATSSMQEGKEMIGIGHLFRTKTGTIFTHDIFDEKYWDDTPTDGILGVKTYDSSMLEGWYSKITKALGETTDETIKKRINVEGLTIRYLLWKVYNNTTYGTKDQIIEDAKKLGVTKFNEGVDVDNLS